MIKLRPAPATLPGTVSNEQKLGWGKTRHRFLSTVSSSHIQMNCITSLCYLFIIWRGKLLDISKCTYAPVVFLHECPFSFFIQHKDNVMDGYITLAKYISIFFLLLYFFSIPRNWRESREWCTHWKYGGFIPRPDRTLEWHSGSILPQFSEKKKKRKNKERKEKEGRHLKSDVMTMPFRNGGRIIKSSSSL